LGKEELDNIKDAFERSWIGLGPKVTEFEQEWSKFIGCKMSLAVNSATAALHLALMAFRFSPGKKVLVPAITFASTAFAPIYNRLEPVFVDVDEDTISISLDDLESKYTSDCVAIIPVHFGGHPVKIDQIMDFARSKNLKVIEDCAHVAGSGYKGKTLGTWGDIGCFSFEEKKAMTTGDGGMMCSDDVDLIKNIQPARWVGIDKDTWKRFSKYNDSGSMDTKHWYYEIAMLGYKYNMNDLSAAIGLAQLKKLPLFNKRRSEFVSRYLDGIEGLKHIKPLMPYDPVNNNYWLFGVRCQNRDKLILFLKSKGIATGVHYMPLTLHPFFSEYKSDCKVAENIWDTFVTLPLHVDLTDKEVDYVIFALQKFDKGI
jgi:perosamine synthetase